MQAASRSLRTLGAIAAHAAVAFSFQAAAIAHAAEAAPPGGTPPLSLPDQVKDIALGSGSLERPLIGLLLTTIGVLFGLLIKSWSDRRVDAERAADRQKTALAEQERDHVAALKAKDDAHAEDRAEWHAATTLLQEARVGQLREVLTGLNASTAFIQETRAAITERNSTAVELVGTIRELVQTVQSSRKAGEEDLGRLSKRIDDALSALGRKS